jgi:inosine-uridine nucleoside N-ribohydrolase
MTYPELKQKIIKIVMMGGAIGKGNITPAAEFNVYFDPHAFDDVLRLKGNIPLVMIPLEVTHENVATQDVFDYFKKNERIPFAKAIYNMLERYKIMYFNNYKIPFPPIHDPCTIFYILHPEELVASTAQIDVDTFPTSYGRTNCYFCNPRNPNVNLESNNIVATHLKNEKTKFWEEMLKILEKIFSEQIQKDIVILNHP